MSTFKPYLLLVFYDVFLLEIQAEQNPKRIFEPSDVRINTLNHQAVMSWRAPIMENNTQTVYYQVESKTYGSWDIEDTCQHILTTFCVMEQTKKPVNNAMGFPIYARVRASWSNLTSNWVETRHQHRPSVEVLKNNEPRIAPKVKTSSKATDKPERKKRNTASSTEKYEDSNVNSVVIVGLTVFSIILILFILIVCCNRYKKRTNRILRAFTNKNQDVGPDINHDKDDTPFCNYEFQNNDESDKK